MALTAIAEAAALWEGKKFEANFFIDGFLQPCLLQANVLMLVP
ncbi:hypothetical protein [Saccharibacillus endophyticus]|nr:hypothetical protein [Saccharibacillus endophyticus]